MGSPSGRLVANIYVIALEEQTLPSLKNDITNWKSYAGDNYE